MHPHHHSRSCFILEPSIVGPSFPHNIASCDCITSYLPAILSTDFQTLHLSVFSTLTFTHCDGKHIIFHSVSRDRNFGLRASVAGSGYFSSAMNVRFKTDIYPISLNVHSLTHSHLDPKQVCRSRPTNSS